MQLLYLVIGLSILATVSAFYGKVPGQQRMYEEYYKIDKPHDDYNAIHHFGMRENYKFMTTFKPEQTVNRDLPISCESFACNLDHPSSHLAAYHFPANYTCEQNITKFAHDYTNVEYAISPWDFCKVPTDGVVCVWCVDGETGDAELAQTCEIEYPDPCIWFEFQFDATCSCTDV